MHQFRQQYTRPVHSPRDNSLVHNNFVYRLACSGGSKCVHEVPANHPCKLNCMGLFLDTLKTNVYLFQLRLVGFSILTRSLNCLYNWNETEIQSERKEFQSNFETVLKLFCFSFVSVSFQLCGQFYPWTSPPNLLLGRPQTPIAGGGRRDGMHNHNGASRAVPPGRCVALSSFSDSLTSETSQVVSNSSEIISARLSPHERSVMFTFKITVRPT